LSYARPNARRRHSFRWRDGGGRIVPVRAALLCAAQELGDATIGERGSMKFRYDINALRALAVTAVVLFHYTVDFVPGGYVGVDVFFVISGYLMTTIIMGRLAKGKFSIWDFYYDRAARIVPGLMAMCLVLLAAGYFLLEPVTYHYLGSTSIAALLFFSNFRFWEATNYFDPQSDTKWLLHTWSLSVEWQFYLVYPIILMALHKFDKSRRHIVPILWSMAFLSFLLCIWFSKAEPASAFYLLPQRAWELLAGGIAALQFKNGERKYSWILLASGTLFIGISVAFYDKTMPWPYHWALLPAIGTCLVIAANRSDAAAFKNALVQTVGKWSYSIYLWHWPIAVAAIYFDFTTITPLKIACEIAILVAILAAGGFLLSVAKKISNRELAKERLPGLLWGGSALALTVGFAIIITSNEGLASRRPDGERQLGVYRMVVADWDYPSRCEGMDLAGNLRPCQLGPPENPGILFIGDSFAMQIFSHFAENAKTHYNSSITFLASHECPPLAGIRIIVDRFDCTGFFEKALHFAETGNFKRIVLVSNWAGYFQPAKMEVCFLDGDACTWKSEPTWYFRHFDAALAGLRSRLLEFRKRGIEIVIVSTTPYGSWDVPRELLKRQFWEADVKDIEYIDREEFERRSAPVKGRLISLAAAIGAKFVDPLDFLCFDNRCPTIDENGVPYFRNLAHFRAAAVRTSRFQFLDDVAGIGIQFSAIPVASKNNP
jgi:peptidoglycan/LPS O-acetylase OafA/YrhL